MSGKPSALPIATVMMIRLTASMPPPPGHWQPLLQHTARLLGQLSLSCEFHPQQRGFREQGLAVVAPGQLSAEQQQASLPQALFTQKVSGPSCSLHKLLRVQVLVGAHEEERKPSFASHRAMIGTRRLFLVEK